MEKGVILRLQIVKGLSAVLFGSTLLLSCSDKMDEPKNNGDDIGTMSPVFDFVTQSEYTLTVDYKLSDYLVMFDIYGENPLEDRNGNLVKKENVQRLFRAITDEKGQFSGKMLLPTALETVYLYSDYVGVPVCIALQVEKGGISFSMNNVSSRLAPQTKAEPLESTYPKGMLVLGGWSSKTGLPNYLLPERAIFKSGLMNDIMYSLPSSKHVRPEFIEKGVVTNITIKDKCKVNLVFMHEAASKMNTVGYFHYPAGSPPATISEAKRILAFPNMSYHNQGGALSSGDQVQIKYWNEEKLQFEEEFPANTVIGWFLTAAGFREGNVIDNQFVFYSIPEFNTNEELQYRQHNVALYDANRKMVAIGFEDTWRTPDRQGSGDNDFNDAVFFVSTYPEGAFDDSNMSDLLPDPNPGPDVEANYIDYSGTLAFEDLWPSRGDYDMNDVVISYKSRHYRDKNNKVIKTVDNITPLWSGATISNGFGYQLGVRNNFIKTVNVESKVLPSSLFKLDANGLELGQTFATIMLFDNIHKVLNETYTITTVFTTPLRQEDILFPPYNPFVTIGSGSHNRRDKEVHLPNMAPTALADLSLLGYGDDKSDIANKLYYVSNLEFPFAIHIPAIFDYPTERQRIDEAYPMYTEWVRSRGQKNKDWYLHKKK